VDDVTSVIWLAGQKSRKRLLRVLAQAAEQRRMLRLL